MRISKQSILTIVAITIGLYIASGFVIKANSNETEVKEEVLSMFDEYQKYVNTKGLIGVEQFFSEDERFYWVEDGTIQYPNRAALLKGIKDFAPIVKKVHLEVIDKQVSFITDNTVSLFVEYKQDLTLESGYAFTLDGAMTILMSKEKGGWKFLIGHSSIKKPRG